MAEQSLGMFASKLDAISKEYEGPKLRKIVTDLGKAAQKDADEALRADIGDQSMSHWRRDKPFDLSVDSKLESDSSVTIGPARKIQGPWRVLNEGRSSYSAGDRRQTGFRTVKKTGERVAKTRKVKRNIGAHGGKGTWNDALGKIEQRTPVRIARANREALARHLKG